LPKRQESVQAESKPTAYPSESEFAGEHLPTHYNEVQATPLEHYVTTYHSGRSDLKEAESTKDKSDLLGKLSSLFKRGHAHENFPKSELYAGPLESTHRHSDLDSHPIDHYVTVTHSGRSDDQPKIVTEVYRAELQEPVQVEEDSGQIFAHQVKSYPEFYQHEGPISETHRHSDLDGEPLESHVTVYAPSKLNHVQYLTYNPIFSPLRQTPQTHRIRPRR
jgi:hypothetical protein